MARSVTTGKKSVGNLYLYDMLEREDYVKGRGAYRHDSWLDSGPFTDVHPVQPVSCILRVNPKFIGSRGEGRGGCRVLNS